jgi:SAM-dependent methyltransferase
MALPACVLCGVRDTLFFHRDKQREFWRCQGCMLVFALPQFYLAPEAERQQYDLHQNSGSDEGYCQFLQRLAIPLMQRLNAGAEGLDFGCGPAPVLAGMFKDSGLNVRVFDKFYARDDSVWNNSFDFISATEVLEHLHSPGIELARLWSHLRKDGYLAVMTKLVIDQDAFARWHYKNDPTHICFFSRNTFLWWAEKHQAKIEFIGSDVIFLRK